MFNSRYKLILSAAGNELGGKRSRQRFYLLSTSTVVNERGHNYCLESTGASDGENQGLDGGIAASTPPTCPFHLNVPCLQLSVFARWICCGHTSVLPSLFYLHPTIIVRQSVKYTQKLKPETLTISTTLYIAKSIGLQTSMPSPPPPTTTSFSVCPQQDSTPTCVME